MERVPTEKYSKIVKESNDSYSSVCPDDLKIRKMRKLAQHHLNGLRIAAFLIRHGFDRMKVRHFVGIYEDYIYPVLYHDSEVGFKKSNRSAPVLNHIKTP